ncbi:MAG: hypothetical protein JWQ09_4570, partial [Segetibacter sp.]|nr:hypothetical protein [Segetibacter sp.]
ETVFKTLLTEEPDEVSFVILFMKPLSRWACTLIINNEEKEKRTMIFFMNMFLPIKVKNDTIHFKRR